MKRKKRLRKRHEQLLEGARILDEKILALRDVEDRLSAMRQHRRKLRLMADFIRRRLES